jgi:alkylhydroperoxidase/carboxymuconolactone decarboxylase family protein YurZ
MTNKQTPAAGRPAPPKAWQRLKDRYPDVAASYEALSDAVRAGGPLDAQTTALVKVAVSVGRGSWRTVHAHAKKALEQQVAPEMLRQVALLALPTIGLPAALDALRWIDESIDEAGAT